MVHPREPFPLSACFQRNGGRVAESLRSIEEVSAMVNSLEADGKGVPVLLRQYVRLNAVLLTFNVDRKFKNAPDGLVVVDLAASDPGLLRRSTGDEGLGMFQKFAEPAAGLGP